MRTILASVIAFFLSAGTATAAPIAYNIIFTTEFTFPTTSANSLAPTAGFTYDSVTGIFTNFLVYWDGYSFDFAHAANVGIVNYGPDPCGLTAGGMGTFQFLQGTTLCPVKRWGGFSGPYPESKPPYPYLTNFGFIDEGPPSQYSEGLPAQFYPYGNASMTQAFGAFTIAAATDPGAAPEPAPWLLFGTGLLGVLFLASAKARPPVH